MTSASASLYFPKMHFRTERLRYESSNSSFENTTISEPNEQKKMVKFKSAKNFLN